MTRTAIIFVFDPSSDFANSVHVKEVVSTLDRLVQNVDTVLSLSCLVFILNKVDKIAMQVDKERVIKQFEDASNVAHQEIRSRVPRVVVFTGHGSLWTPSERTDIEEALRSAAATLGG